MLFKLETVLDPNTPAICNYDHGAMDADQRVLLELVRRHVAVLEADGALKQCRCTVRQISPIMATCPRCGQQYGFPIPAPALYTCGRCETEMRPTVEQSLRHGA